jgi:hypothetical protein
MSFYRLNKESIQNNQNCQILRFFRQQIIQTSAFQKILLLRKSSFRKAKPNMTIGGSGQRRLH